MEENCIIGKQYKKQSTKMVITNIADKAFDGLKVEKLLNTGSCETLIIRIEATHLLPNHKTSKAALLVMQQGEAIFEIEGKKFNLKQGDNFIIPASIEHSVFANTDSILLIIR